MKKVLFIVVVACAMLSLVSGAPVVRRDDDLDFFESDILEEGQEKFFGGDGRGNVFRPTEGDDDNDDDSDGSDGTADVPLATGKSRWFGGNGRGMVFRRAVEDTANAEQIAGAANDQYFGGPRGGGVF